jgi:hypothetical protein
MTASQIQQQELLSIFNQLTQGSRDFYIFLMSSEAERERLAAQPSLRLVVSMPGQTQVGVKS